MRNVLVTISFFSHDRATIHSRQLQEHRTGAVLQQRRVAEPTGVKTATERVAHKLKCDSVLLLKVYTYRHICIHVYIFLFYIISIFHSISVNKVKSVSKNPKGNKCDKGHSWKPFYIIVVIHFFDY